MNSSKPITVNIAAAYSVTSFFWDEMRAASRAVAEQHRLAQEQSAKSAVPPRKAAAPAARTASRAVTAATSVPPPRPKR